MRSFVHLFKKPYLRPYFLVAFVFVSLLITPKPVFAESLSITTTKDWEAGTLSNIDTQGTLDSIQNESSEVWGANTWKTPDLTLTLGATFTTDGTDIYVFRGGGDILFWKYEPSKNEWTTLANTPRGIYYGADITYLDGYIYAVTGSYQKTFARYSIANNAWEVLTDVPDIVHEGASIVTDGTNIFVLRGYMTQEFYKYDVAASSWTTLSGTPHTIRRGSDAVYNDGYIYATRGYNETRFYRYDIAANTWTSMSNTPGLMYEDVDITTDGTSIFATRQNNTTEHYKYTIATDTWTVLAPLPAAARYGGSVYLPADGYEYIFRGNNTYDFWKYDSATNSYLGYAPLPVPFYTGSDLLYHNQYIYSPRGSNTASFYRFNITTNTWESLASSPVLFNDDTKGTVAGDTMYFFRGSNYLDFVSYSITGNSWSTLAEAPATVRYGGALAYPGSGDYLYATRGNYQYGFWRYSISGNTWDDAAVADVPIDARQTYGSRLVSDGGDGMYFIAGAGSKRMLKYSISTNQWTELSAVPFAAYYGTDITYDSGKIIALAGWYTRDVWEYTIATDSWRKIKSLPGYYAQDLGTLYGASIKSDGAGNFFATYGNNRLEFLNFTASEDKYVSSGTWTSAVQDLGYVASFSSFSSTQTATSDSFVTYQTRTSADRGTWSSWQSVSGSTIQSPPQQYLQVRALLATSSDGAVTPNIADITVTYTGDENAPTNPDTVIGLSQQVGGEVLSSGQSYRHTHPSFSWTGAADGETAIAGYYVYFGTNAAADPETAGTYQTTASYVVTKPLGTGTYYLLLKTVDTAENVSATTTAFEYLYGGISPAQSFTVTDSTSFTGTATDVQVTGNEIKLASTPGGFWKEEVLSTTPATMQYGAKSIAYVENTGKLYVFRGANVKTFYEYDIATDTWTTKADAPANVYIGGGVIEGPDGYLYGFAGGNTTSFWRYDIATDTWTDAEASDSPLTIYYGSSLVFDGNQSIYALRGYNDDAFWRYDTTFDTWDSLAGTDFGFASKESGSNNVYLGGDLAIDPVNRKVYAIQGNLMDGFAVYDIDTNAWSLLTDVPQLAYLGAAIEYDPSTGSIFYLPAYNTDLMYRYDIGTGDWTRKADAPQPIYYGASMRYVDGNIYTIRGGNSNSFYKYSIAKDSWLIPSRGLFGEIFRGAGYLTENYGADILKGDGHNYYITRGNFADQFVRWNEETGEMTPLANAPAGLYIGSSLVYDSVQNKIYLTSNQFFRKFYVYDIATNVWSEETLDPPLGTPNYGSSMVYDGAQYIYMNLGANSTLFYRYDTQATAGSRWSVMPTAPGTLGHGAELLIDNGYIYTLRGQNVANNPFYRFDIAGNSWSTLAPLGINVYNDGFLVNGGNGSFYAERGQNDTDFFKYTVADNSWETLDDAPARVYAGGAAESNESDRIYMLSGSGSYAFQDAIYTYVMDTDTSGFSESGSYQTDSHDFENVYKWASLDVNLTDSQNAQVSISTRTSDDTATWSSWTAVSSEKIVGTLHSYKIHSPAAQYIQVLFELTSGDGVYSNSIKDYTINYYKDTTPPTNPATIGLSAYSDATPGDAIVSDTWYSSANPHFDWPDAEATNGASDTLTGAGVSGYYVYFGTDIAADPTTAGALQADSSFTATGLTNGETYYLRVQAVDDAGNVATAVWAPFIYKFDSTPASKPTSITADPSGYSSIDSFDFSWDTASTSGAPITNYCYKTGATSGTYASDQCTTSTTITAIPSYKVGANTLYVRTQDAAGNYSEYGTTQYYYVDSANAPAPPTNLTVLPSSNTTNSFAFTWDAPAVGTYFGSVANLSYYYSINALPTVQSTTSTSLRELKAGAYATLPGENVFYIVTKDEAGNINYTNYASVTFTANTTAPGIPLNIDIADVSVKSTSSWKLAISWEAPTSGGTPASYAVYRSLDGVSYSLFATSGGISYVDVGLIQQEYYYKIKACDSTNNCGEFSDEVSLFPDGKFVTPADLIAAPVASSVTTKKGTVSWSTSRTCDSKIAYGTSSGEYFDEEVSNSEHVTSHILNLTNLAPGTTYYYVAKWTDEDGNTGQSEEMTFETQPPPTTEEPVEKSIGLDSVLLEFTSKNAARVRIYYGESSAFGGSEDVVTGSGEGVHTVLISGLTDGTKYFYKINSFDSEGAEYEGEIHSFTTLPRPKISNVKVSQVKGTARSTLLLSWESNTAVSSIVTYYPINAPSLAKDEVNIALKNGKHQMILYDLEPQTTYGLIIKGKDAVGNEAAGELQQVSTSADTRPPEIADLKVESEIIGTGEEATAQLVVSYSTDEPSTAQIEYGEGSGTTYSQKTQEDASLSNNHLVVISGLTPAKVYHLRAISKDSYLNDAFSIDKVVITQKATENALDLVISNLSATFGFLGSN